MGLDVALVHRGSLVAPLDDERSLCKARLKIAVAHLDHRRQVGGCGGRLGKPGGHEPFIDEGRAFCEGRVEGQHRRERLVLHLDEGQGRKGLGPALRRHSRHGMAVVAHLTPGNDVPREIGEITAAFTAFDGASSDLGEIRARHHGLDAGGREGRVRLNALDSRMGVRRAQHGPLKHAGQGEVGAKAGPPRHLVHAIGPDRAGSNHLKIHGFAHAASPRISAAASSTARMILS